MALLLQNCSEANIKFYSKFQYILPVRLIRRSGTCGTLVAAEIGLWPVLACLPEV